MKAYSKMSKGHQVAMLIEVIIALLAIAAAIVNMLLMEKDREAEAATLAPGPSAEIQSEVPTEPSTEPALLSDTEAPTDTLPVSDAAAELPADSSEAVSIDAAASESAAPGIDFSNVVFIGDSRTLSLSNGGPLAYELVPSDAVNATWGGTLTQNEAFSDALAAAQKGRQKAVFWFGINDVQLNPDRDNAETFIANYDQVIRTYTSTNPNSVIYILSVLNTSVNEKDYYEGQDRNVQEYNIAIMKYCGDNGFNYLNVEPLLTGEECFVPEDHIHFTKAWYENSFVPMIANALELYQ